MYKSLSSSLNNREIFLGEESEYYPHSPHFDDDLDDLKEKDTQSYQDNFLYQQQDDLKTPTQIPDQTTPMLIIASRASGEDVGVESELGKTDTLSMAEDRPVHNPAARESQESCSLPKDPGKMNEKPDEVNSSSIDDKDKDNNNKRDDDDDDPPPLLVFQERIQRPLSVVSMGCQEDENNDENKEDNGEIVEGTRRDAKLPMQPKEVSSISMSSESAECDIYVNPVSDDLDIELEREEQQQKLQQEDLVGIIEESRTNLSMKSSILSCAIDHSQVRDLTSFSLSVQVEDTIMDNSDSSSKVFEEDTSILIPPPILSSTTTTTSSRTTTTAAVGNRSSLSLLSSSPLAKLSESESPNTTRTAKFSFKGQSYSQKSPPSKSPKKLEPLYNSSLARQISEDSIRQSTRDNDSVGWIGTSSEFSSSFTEVSLQDISVFPKRGGGGGQRSTAVSGLGVGSLLQSQMTTTTEDGQFASEGGQC